MLYNISINYLNNNFKKYFFDLIFKIDISLYFVFLLYNITIVAFDNLYFDFYKILFKGY